MSCENPDTCKFCNPEPLTLEGDIRYLKAHIETKNRQLAEKDAALAEAKLRIDIYREAWQDAEKETIKLREENEKLKQRSTEQNDWLVRLQQENKKLREENERLRNANAQVTDGFNLINKDRSKLVQEKITLEQHKARYQEEILDLERHNEELFAALNSVRNLLMRAGDDIESLIRVD